jgi:hypothetical protein
MIEQYYWNDEIFGENWFSYPDLYKQVVEEFPSGSKFVEVGSWKGRSSSFLAVEIANSGKDIDFYCVDTWEGGPDHQGWEGLDKLYDIFLENMKPVEGYYFPLKVTSEEASKKFEDKSLDFVFLDASHEYEDIKSDIQNWLPKVKPGGIIAGHDYYVDGYDWFPGVKQAVNEELVGFEARENCFVYRVPFIQEKEDLKILFFGRSCREDVWEYDFILNEILPQDKNHIVKFLSLDEVRSSDEKFDIFIYSCRDPSNYSWGYMPTYNEALECVLKTSPKIIIQLSDEFEHEYLQNHNDLANYCELFLRQHHHSNYTYHPNTVHIPLGYYNDFSSMNGEKIFPVKDRILNWSLVGFEKENRRECVEKLSEIDNHYFYLQPLQEGWIKTVGPLISKQKIRNLYLNSIFVPGTRGWTTIETNRMYESSMTGAIPVVFCPKEEFGEKFKHLQNPPWIVEESWDDIVSTCKDLLNDLDRLQEIQNDVLSWWNNLMTNIQTKVKECLERDSILRECRNKLKNFPSINFISVSNSEERRNLLYEKFNDYGLTNIIPHIFESYDDSQHNFVGEAINTLHGVGRGPTTSHLKAIRDWYCNTDEEYGFFCEDDISFETVKYWNFTWEEFLSRVPEDWGCIQLSWVREEIFRFSIEGVKIRHRCWCDWSACAYLMRRSHAEKILNHYYDGETFNLDYIGNDSHVRPYWALRPTAETIIFSFVNPVYGFPLFVEDVVNCKSTLNLSNIDFQYPLSDDILNNIPLNEYKYLNLVSYREIINWWKTTGKNLKYSDI